MKFVVQKIENEIRHDFVYELLDSVRFQNWIRRHDHDKVIVRYVNTKYNNKGLLQPPKFKNYQSSYVPIGTVEFVTTHLEQFYGLTPKPLNVPECLFQFAKRGIFNGTNLSLEGLTGRWFVKSNDKIKGYCEYVTDPTILSVPPGENYQISTYISIDSEWRAFVYKHKLVGLRNYVGEFTIFPDVEEIHEMIKLYKENGAPVAYTLDVGINHEGTFIIEAHDFFSCGLYGFQGNGALANMFYRWYKNYIKENSNG